VQVNLRVDGIMGDGGRLWTVAIARNGWSARLPVADFVANGGFNQRGYAIIYRSNMDAGRVLRLVAKIDQLSRLMFLARTKTRRLVCR
jgi:hypothetical protein